MSNATKLNPIWYEYLHASHSKPLAPKEKAMFRVRVDNINYEVPSEKPLVLLSAVLTEAASEYTVADLFYVDKDQQLQPVEEKAVIPAGAVQQFYTEAFVEYL